MNGEVTKTISKLGVDLFISQIAFGSISLIYNIFLGQYGGDIAISFYAIISSIMTFVIMPAGRLSQGIRPILGYCYGVKKYERVKYIMKVGCLISSTIMIFIWIWIELFVTQLVYLLGGTQNDDWMTLGVTAWRVNFSLIPLIGFVLLLLWP